MAANNSLPPLQAMISMVPIKLESSTYLLWKRQFLQVARVFGLAGYLDGSIPAPDATIASTDGSMTPNPAYDAWMLKDQTLQSVIWTSLSQEALNEISDCSTASSTWDALHKAFSDSSASRNLQLRDELFSLRRGSLSVHEYGQQFRTLCDQLAAIGNPLSETDKSLWFLRGLGPQYTSFSDTRLHSSPVPGLRDLISQAKRYEASLSLDSSLTSQAAFAAQHVPQFRPSPTPPFAPPTSSTPNQQNRGGRGGRGRGGRGRGRRNYPPRCQICRGEHYADKCPNRYANPAATNPDANIALTYQASTTAAPQTSDWYLDSGATAHMTNNQAGLDYATPYNGDGAVVVGNGSSLPISHIGNYSLADNIALMDVLVVPSLTKNLLSVSKLTSDLPVDILISNDSFAIQNRSDKQVLARGRRDRGLYTLDRSVPALVAALRNRSLIGSFDLWHSRLGHVPSRVISLLNKKGFLSTTSTSSSSTLCTACQLAKSKHLPFPLNEKRASDALDLVHCDLWGPAPIPSSDGYSYYVVFIDDFSRFSWLFPLKRKSDFYDVLLQFHRFVCNQLSRTIKIFQSDGGTEFLNHKVRDFMNSQGILHRISCPYTPQQNGRAERKHRHITEMGLSMLLHANAPKEFWFDAFISAVFIINRIPSSILKDKSPFEVLYGSVPNYTLFRPFGCRVFPYLRDYAKTKLSPRSHPCVFLGYSSTYKGFKCLDPSSSRVYITRHAQFDEALFPYSAGLNSSSPNELDLIGFDDSPSRSQHSGTIPPRHWPIDDEDIIQDQPLVMQDSPAASPHASPRPATANSGQKVAPRLSPHVSPRRATANIWQCVSPRSSPHASPRRATANFGQNAATDAQVSSPRPSPHPAAAHPLPADHGHLSPPLATPSIHSHPTPSQMCSNPPQHIMTTRAKAGIIKPNPRYFVDLSYTALLASLTTNTVPRGFKSAAKSPIWLSAMQEEIDALHENNTWDLVPPPSGVNIVGSKWVFRTKFKADGSIDRHKARLVAQGFTQIYGSDFHHTFSPVVKSATVRVILALAVHNGWVLHQLDVKNAFLNGVLDRPVYMDQPPGFTDPRYPTHVCRLKKALYGLRQAPLAWFQRFSSYLLTLGFRQSRADPSLFAFHHADTTIYLLLYVDDIILTGNNSSALQAFIARTHKEFALKDLGRLNYFLGLEVTSTDNGIFIGQAKYAHDILQRAELLDAKPVATPLAAGEGLVKDGEPFHDHTLFRSLVGALQYLTITRPDLSYAVNSVSQFLQAPTTDHFHAVKRILRYVKGTIHFGLSYSRRPDLSIIGYSDADWARCIDTRRSTYGYAIFLGGNLISWSAKKQPTVARSSCESEYRAMANTSAELVWLANLLSELRLTITSPIQLLCDNKSALFLSQNPVAHKRAKHIDLDYHFIRELVSSGKITTTFVPSHLQLADIFTKSLPRPAFELIRSKLCVSLHPTQRLTGGNSVNNKKETPEDSGID